MITQETFEAPYERAGVLTSGLPILDFGVERHVVPGGGSRAVLIESGDAISVLDREGLQIGELVFFAPDGTSDAGMIGAVSTGRAEVLKSVLEVRERSAKHTAQKLEKAGFDVGRADGVRIFGNRSRPGDMETFHAERDGLLIVSSLGGSMRPEEQNPPTELILYVRRANPKRYGPRRPPPDPLADAVTDHNIEPGEAKAFEVEAGQFIQIIDNQGRECSDFQAFSRRALDKGLEREIDPTTTRSLVGLLYPAPGLYSK